MTAESPIYNENVPKEHACCDSKEPDHSEESHIHEFHISTPPFSIPVIQSIRHDYEIPQHLQISDEVAAEGYETEEATGYVYSKNGVVIDYTQIEGWHVKSLDRRYYEASLAAYCYDQCSLQTLSFIKRLRLCITVVRKKGNGVCTFLDVFNQLIDRAKDFVIDDLIVLPRLVSMRNAMLNPKMSQVKEYTVDDIDKANLETYIGFTVMFLAGQFAGGERMLVYNNNLISSTAITLYGQELFHRLHLAIPPLDWCFRKAFVARVMTYEYPPHSYQYSSEGFAMMIWLAFRNSIDVAIAATSRFVRNHLTDAQFSQAVNSYIATRNKEREGRGERPVDIKRDYDLLADRCLDNMACGLIIHGVPHSFGGVKELSDAATKYSLQPHTLYLAKIAFDLEGPGPGANAK
jgi:hypothetical protein